MTDPTQDDDEALLSRFRDWLLEARSEANSLNQSRVDSSTETHPQVGLYRLVEEFTALRHEVKLETKGSRGLQEQIETLLPAIRQAMDLFRAIGPKEEQAVLGAARPLAESIADLDEALDRGRLEIEKARDRALAETRSLVASTSSDLDAHFLSQPWFRRFRHRAYHDQVRNLVARKLEEARPGLFEALLEGYGLIQSRLKRAMDAGQVRRIECLGLAVDPDRMIVLEVVETSEQEPGHVVDEVRRGYTWRGRVLRYAEVRAARERPLKVAGAELDAEDEEDVEVAEMIEPEPEQGVDGNVWN